MWAIGLSVRRHWLEIAWAIFSLVNLSVMWLWSRWETVPFHFIWVSLTLLYGVRVWSTRSTTVVLSAIMLSTGAVIIRDAVMFAENADEYPRCHSWQPCSWPWCGTWRRPRV